MKISVNQQSVSLSAVTYNDGLNYGRFDGNKLQTFPYTLNIDREDLIQKFHKQYSKCSEEIRHDDEKIGDNSPFKEMNYVSLDRAFEYPKQLAEAIRIFFDRQIFELYIPWNESAHYIINSSDKILVTQNGLTIEGKCFVRV